MSKILIADDHSVVRMAVSILLKKAGHQIVGEAGSGLDVVALVRRLEPDLLILDIDMPKLDGFSVLQRLSAGGGGVKTVVFSGLDTERYAIRCSRAGAHAFVSKNSNLDELLSAVKIVLTGYVLFPSTEFSSVGSSSGMASEEQLLKMLSDREIAVLRHLSRGYRIKEIAQLLMISEKTISTYKARLIEKLKVKNFLELVDLVKRNHLL
ncbi:response regulator transcription factor [Pseudomonas sp. Irchel s3a18]|uniref:response regulator transcription factor n=1 Tax=Pseudomonas sp. Irchel s3a18 TaxID=2009053 RepID=UPI00117B9708|nr:response regulator transcription factor [Pseudomonas sp. Irchel s3a18]